MDHDTHDRPASLPESRLYTFIDSAREYALYFLEGQRLIHDLALTHGVHGGGFAYFRDAVLSVQPMIALLKHGEQLGFYIDSDRPFFRLKIETSHLGATRCALLPEDFAEFPQSMSGVVRVLKLFPNNQLPYQSVLEVDDLPLREIVNRVLRASYQVNSAMMVSDASDQSLMLHQLPPLPSEADYDYSAAAVRARREGIREGLEQIFDRALHGPEEIESAFAALGFRLLSQRTVRFDCPCSRENMLRSLRSVYRTEGDELFESGRDTLTVVCEYCKTVYDVSRSELIAPADPPN